MDEITFPNRLIKKSKLRSQVLEILGPNVYPVPTMDTIRELIEAVLASQDDLKGVEDTPSLVRRVRLKRGSKIAVRKMLSRYWDNWSPFALDLGGAVMRQGTFVEKMVKIDWLHSPSARETMARLLTKYSRFFAIMSVHPLNVAVPTLDVDLAWHTHQLCPGAYYRYSKKKTTKFIDHDDKIDEGKLSQSFEWTSKVYQDLYGEVYSECTCWYCEGKQRKAIIIIMLSADTKKAIRASHVSSVGRLVGKLGVGQPSQEKGTHPFLTTITHSGLTCQSFRLILRVRCGATMPSRQFSTHFGT